MTPEICSSTSSVPTQPLRDELDESRDDDKQQQQVEQQQWDQKQQHQRHRAPGYIRGYQACFICRQRKVRCDMGPIENPTGPPSVAPVPSTQNTSLASERNHVNPASYDQTHTTDLFEGVTVRSAPASVSVNSATCEFDQQHQSDLPSLAQSAADTATTTARKLAQTAVYSSTDALNLLCEASESVSDCLRGHKYSGKQSRRTRDSLYDTTSATSGIPSEFGSNAEYDTSHSSISSCNSNNNRDNSTQSSVEMDKEIGFDPETSWRESWFVMSGLISAREALLLINFYFAKLYPCGLILCMHYSNPHTHKDLIRFEPILCHTLLTISSRYYAFEGPGNVSRQHIIHDRLWSATHALVQQVLWGQFDRNDKLRTLGTIEALMLLTEWHPRGIHFPSLSGHGATFDSVESLAPDSCLRSVRQSSFCSDRMSWMLLGVAVSLAYELGVLLDDDDAHPIPLNGHKLIHGYAHRTKRVQILLCIYCNQLAVRLGWMSMIPRHVVSSVLNKSLTGDIGGHGGTRETAVHALIRLAMIIRNASELLPGRENRNILKKGGHISLLEHLNTLLNDWWDKFQQLNTNSPLRENLIIEYHYARIYINAIALQAIADVGVFSGPINTHVQWNLSSQLDVRALCGSNLDYVTKLRDASLQILMVVVAKMPHESFLKYGPVRIYTRIISACIFLLKSLALCGNEENVQLSLSLLRQVAQVLRDQSIDDIHLTLRFAGLLNALLDRLQQPEANGIQLEVDYNSVDGYNYNYKQRNQLVISPPLSDTHGGGISGSLTVGDEVSLKGQASTLWPVDGLFNAPTMYYNRRGNDGETLRSQQHLGFEAGELEYLEMLLNLE
ncbi:hypothetical protein V1527DRAFT_492626 [Lipomyces starkeyi]